MKDTLELPNDFEMKIELTSIYNISTEGAASRKVIVHRRSNSTYVDTLDEQLP
jgi:hypothetical protein